MKDEQAEIHAKRLDDAYRGYVARRAAAKASCLALIESAGRLAAELVLTQALVRGSFSKWCRVHCRVFDPKVRQAVAAIGQRPVAGRVETWQLRVLGVISAIHHAARPVTSTRRAKAPSWMASVGAVHDRVRKVIEQAGGVDKLDDNTRKVMARQLGTVSDLQRELNQPRDSEHTVK